MHSHCGVKPKIWKCFLSCHVWLIVRIKHSLQLAPKTRNCLWLKLIFSRFFYLRFLYSESLVLKGMLMLPLYTLLNLHWILCHTLLPNGINSSTKIEKKRCVINNKKKYLFDAVMCLMLDRVSCSCFNAISVHWRIIYFSIVWLRV